MRDVTSNRGGLEVIALVISAFTCLATIGGWIWFGGRLSQRVDDMGKDVAQVRIDINAGRDANSRQDSDIAVNKSQYTEIITRLNRIDAKLEYPRR